MSINLLTPHQESQMRKEVKILRLRSASLANANKLLKQRISLLAVENKTLKAQLREHDQLIKSLEKELVNLKNQKKTYTGMIFKSNVAKNTESLRGKNFGYKGSSRFNPKNIDEVITVKCDVCPDCGSKLKLYNGVYEHIVEDIVLPVKKTKVIKYLKCRQYCPCCKKEVIAVHENEIPNSSFGPAISAMILMLKYEVNVTLPKIKYLLSTLFGIDITIPGIQSQLSVSKRHFEKAYSEILTDIRASPVKHAPDFCDLVRFSGVDTFS